MPDYKDPLPDFSGVSSGKAPPKGPPADFSGVAGGASSTAPGSTAPGARTHTVVRGDSLSKLAKSFYGNERLWRKIYDANKEVVGKNPDLIKPGQVLNIPDA